MVKNDTNIVEYRKKLILNELCHYNLHKKPNKWQISFAKKVIVSRLAHNELPIISHLLYFANAIMLICLGAFLVCFYQGYWKLSAILAACEIISLFFVSLMLILIRQKEREIRKLCNEIIEAKIKEYGVKT